MISPALNMEMDEWTNPDAPPAFDDIASGMAFMDEQGKAALQELEAEARKRMAADQDPREQNYFLRTDKRTVVRTDKEYVYCQLNDISLRMIPYSAAVQALKEQESRDRNKAKGKQKKKAANKARRKNR